MAKLPSAALSAARSRAARAEATCAKAEEALLRLESMPADSALRIALQAAHATGEKLLEAEARIEHAERSERAKIASKILRITRGWGGTHVRCGIDLAEAILSEDDKQP